MSSLDAETFAKIKMFSSNNKVSILAVYQEREKFRKVNKFWSVQLLVGFHNLKSLFWVIQDLYNFYFLNYINYTLSFQTCKP